MTAALEAERASDDLGADGRLASDLWLDRPDAHRAIDRRLAAGRLDDTQAAALRGFADDGYLSVPIEIPERIFRQLDEALERLWREKPAEVGYAYRSQLRPFALADPERERKPSYRIADLHAHEPAALELYLHRQVFDWVELIFDAKAVATQSLLFELGSQQDLHRDPTFVHHEPLSHLLGAWIALEDIHPDSGPLTYARGSHRLPYYQFAPGQARFDPQRWGTPELEAMRDFHRAQASDLPIEVYTPRRGQLLLWHASLLHGGTPAADLARTRKSFVIHFTTFGDLDATTQIVEEPQPDGTVAYRTVACRKLLSRDGCYGFDSPLRQD